MMIGIDFDNTIVCYDHIFYSEAVQRGLIPSHLPPFKHEIRNHLRQAGKEKLWTDLQGYIYGPGIKEAEPYPGVMLFLKQCQGAGIKTCIISHKTRYPYAGKKYDLHQTAIAWLEDNHFFAAEHTGLTADAVIFAPSKQEKLERIRERGCHLFIDDLPEFLAETSFPGAVAKILFDPHNLHSQDSRYTRISSFAEALVLIPQVVER